MEALFLFTTILPVLVAETFVWTKLALFSTLNVPLLLVIAPATVIVWPSLIINDLEELTVKVFAVNPAVSPEEVEEKLLYWKEKVPNAEVTLISGPTHLSINNDFVQVINVNSAQEMYDHCHKHYKTSDVFIGAAAVADYKPKNQTFHKIKKRPSTFTIDDLLANNKTSFRGLLKQ